MRPHFLQTCSRSESFFGTLAPHGQRCDVPLASTFANRRPASSALYASFATNDDHEASCTAFASIPPARPFTFRSSTKIIQNWLTSMRASFFWLQHSYTAEI